MKILILEIQAFCRGLNGLKIYNYDTSNRSAMAHLPKPSSIQNPVNTLRSRQNGRHMQTTFVSAFSWTFEF